MKRPLKRSVVILIKLVVIGILIWLVGRALVQSGFEPEKLLQSLRAGWRWLVLAQVFIFAILFLTFYRWKLLLEAQEIYYTTGEATALGFIGFFFSQFIPGSTGGDLVKAYYVAVDHPQRRAAGITTVFLDRVIGLLDLVILAGVAILINWKQIVSNPWLKGLAIMVGVILAGSLASGLLFFSERFRSNPWVLSVLKRFPLQQVLGKIQAAVYIYKYHPWLILLAVLLSAVVQLSIVAMAFCYSMALGLNASIWSFFFIVPLATLAMAVPIGSPGGLGQLEYAYIELFKLFGYQQGPIFALLQRLNWYVWGAVGGVFYLKRRGKISRARQLADLSKGELEFPNGAGEEAELLQAGKSSPSPPVNG